MKTRMGMKKVHQFRSKVLQLIVYEDRLYALTERGLYYQQSLHRWRKIEPDFEPSTPVWI